MANATTRVSVGTTDYLDVGIKRRPVTTAQIYYPGAMIALNASGLGDKCDNTAGLTFDGINAATVRLQIVAGDDTTDPARQLEVERPFRIQMYIAAAVVADIGKAVYALYDNEVSYSTSNSIQVGWVDDVISSTLISIRPVWAGQRGTATFDGNTLTFTGATGLNIAAMPDNLADALSFAEGSNKYLTFITTDGSEAIALKKNTTLAGTMAITSASATAFTVGRLGSTTPALLVDASTATSITGFSVKSAAAGNGLALAAIGETNVNVILDAKGSGTLSLNTVATGNIVLGRATTGVSLAVTAGITSSGPTGAGIGYATGAGGTVTQATDRSTGVTLSKLTGAITTDTTSLAAGAEAEFTVTNTTVAATDVVVVSLKSGNTGIGTCVPVVTGVAAGSFKIMITNTHTSTAEVGACVLNFAVLKGVAA